MAVMGKQVFYPFVFMVMRMMVIMPMPVLLSMMMRYKSMPKHNNACN